jgi:hypothetical protein
MIPANGASTFWKDWSASSRCTLASLAATVARAASTLASRAPRLACDTARNFVSVLAGRPRDSQDGDSSFLGESSEQ